MGFKLRSDMLVACLGMGLMLHLTPFASLTQVALTAPYSHDAAYLDFNLFMFNMLGFTLGCAFFSVWLRRFPRDRVAGSPPLQLAVHTGVALIYSAHCLIPGGGQWAAAHVMAATAAGAFSSLAFAIWGNWLTLSYSTSEGNFVLAGALFVASVTKVALGFVPGESPVLACVFGLASSVGSFVCLWRLSRGEVLLPDRGGRVGSVAGMPRITALLFLGSGFVMTCLLAMLEYSGVAFEVQSTSAFVAVAVALLASHRLPSLQRWITMSRYARLTSYAVAVGALGFLVLHGSLPAIAAFLAAVAWFSQVTFVMGSIVDLASSERCSFVGLWATYCLLCGVGIFLGLVLVFLAQGSALDFVSVLAAATALVVAGIAIRLPGALNGTREFHRGSFADGETPEQRAARRERYLEDAYALTAREMEVVRCLVRGLSYRMISVELGITENTVRAHVKNLYAKCGVHSRGELVVLLGE